MEFYLWEQAVPGKEPLKKDRNGRFTKQDDHRWTKDWISQNYLGKGGNYTARAVVAGDPSLAIETIGVPLEIAQKLTVPERATKWNRSKLQEYVDRTQMLQQGSGKPGATRIVRNEEAFQVWANSTHTVQIGDVIHRNIQDGDFVYVNRPPSVHKHSLMALKVQVHYGLVLTINPLVCPPFNADFDGDIFHVFIPQSLQAIAELEHLMAVPQQIISDHGGQPLLGLTQVIVFPFSFCHQRVLYYFLFSSFAIFFLDYQLYFLRLASVNFMIVLLVWMGNEASNCGS